MDADFDEQVSCPYHPAHVMLRGRVQTHIVKCRHQFEKDNGVQQTTTCCFNSTHVIPLKEKQVHELLCVERRTADEIMFEEDRVIAPAPNHITLVGNIAGEENWDNEEVETSVLELVKERAKSKPVLLNPAGLPPAERKKHRLEQKQRFRDYTANKN